MTQLFEPSAILSLQLKNRLVRSATMEGMADDRGICSPQLVDYLTVLAKNEVGLIIPGHAYVSQAGQARGRQLAVHTDNHIDGLRTLTQSVHDHGAKIALQISHAGCYGRPEVTGSQALGPSIQGVETGLQCQEMTYEAIHEVIGDFVKGALRAQSAGFDGVQIHAAHGYLLSQFFSPFFNKRTDDYGGPLENRARLTLAVVRSVKEATGPKFPVMIKLNAEDYLEGGFTQEEMLQVAKMLQNAGVDAIELSGGTRSGRYSPSRLGNLVDQNQEVYYREAASLYKTKIDVPLMLVGGIRSFDVGEKLVRDGLADYVSLSRPLIREPDLIRRWRSGDSRKATCISCNLCYRPALEGKGVRCVVEEDLKK